jgi:Ca2+-binding EF-hand superfamily protein
MGREYANIRPGIFRSIRMKTPAKTTFEIILVVTVVIAFAAAPLLARAADQPPRGPVPFAEFDADNSGFVSEEEFNATRAAHLAAMAAAGRPMKGAATAPSFADLDSDEDGQLSEEELTAGQKAHMRAMHGHGKHGKGMHKRHGKMHHAKAQKAQPKTMKMATFEDIDTDGDGSISREEFAAHHASHHGQQEKDKAD